MLKLSWGRIICLTLIICMLISIRSINSEMKGLKGRTISFDGNEAFKHLEKQMTFGPRTIGSLAHNQTVEYIQDILSGLNWTVKIQNFTYEGYRLRNLEGIKTGNSSIVIISAHYDCRWHADRDRLNSTTPVPGANDGASGVGVLLELGRVLQTDFTVWLVFFDAEDQGSINNWPWIVGSTYFVSQISPEDRTRIKAVINVDMIGDEDLNLPKERSSTPELTDAIWNVAKSLNYPEFIDNYKYSILDDHRPFLDAGIPAVDIIDFDYPYWHTQNDTTDKCSSKSLETVGRVLEVFIEETNISFTETQIAPFAGVGIITAALIYKIVRKKQIIARQVIDKKSF
ncbi:MAG: M28 family peptidase [Candidatus Hodarchaeota archaeon]